MTDISRRKIVTALGVGATVSLAGCNGGTSSDGSDGSDGSDETNGSDGEDSTGEVTLPEGFTETGVENLQTALGPESAFYNKTVVETEFTINAGSTTIENYHYANHDEQILFQEQVSPTRTLQNYYADGTYYTRVSSEGVDPQYQVQDIEWQRNVVYYFPIAQLLTEGELTLEQTDEGFRYVTEDVANASAISQISQLVRSRQSSGDTEPDDPVSEFTAELSFTSDGVPTSFSYSVTTESGEQESGEATYTYEAQEITEPDWVSEAEAQSSSTDDGSSDGGSTDGSTSDGGSGSENLVAPNSF